MLFRIRWLVALVIVIVAAMPSRADGEVTLAGSFVWERGNEIVEGDLEVVFMPRAEHEWAVAFHFEWEEEPHVFPGTVRGSLAGELIGNVASDDPSHPLKFEFQGTFSEGTFRGTHGYFNGSGELVHSGTLQLAPAKSQSTPS